MRGVKTTRTGHQRCRRRGFKNNDADEIVLSLGAGGQSQSLSTESFEPVKNDEDQGERAE